MRQELIAMIKGGSAVFAYHPRLAQAAEFPILGMVEEQEAEFGKIAGQAVHRVLGDLVDADKAGAQGRVGRLDGILGLQRRSAKIAQGEESQGLGPPRGVASGYPEFA